MIISDISPVRSLFSSLVSKQRHRDDLLFHNHVIRLIRSRDFHEVGHRSEGGSIAGQFPAQHDRYRNATKRQTKHGRCCVSGTGSEPVTVW